MNAATFCAKKSVMIKLQRGTFTVRQTHGHLIVASFVGARFDQEGCSIVVFCCLADRQIMLCCAFEKVAQQLNRGLDKFPFFPTQPKYA